MEDKKYKVEFTETSERELKKLDKHIAKLIKKWIVTNLIDTDNPRKNGKALVGNLRGIWRYRVGSFRIVAEIKDKKLIILIIEIGDRKVVYKK